ncbi:zinc-dependent alcohol dehydrogenase family protein [Variovorax sp. JS1663]|uniref:zinc-dependent alcohol dehydrogenase family protein n=1 Tax=Variovorax sp. JS1663 TaxID=1851577 RepID=UPI000B34222D|nr:zinc-dependent alcohol dehydrogenase family protein [Variovorax sp. JS1663]OUM04062.1 NADPH:quinone oxidoreductase [Variovorax sp. JS1663]
MKAIVLKKFGGPESFELQDVKIPEVGIGELLVRVIATAINPLDYQIRRGDYPDYVPLPAIIGHDVSGVVEKVGPGVADFAVGDEVFYTPQIFGPKGGSYAQYNVVPETLVTRKPANLTHEEAASTTLVGGTAWEALVTRARLRPAESVLIHGGAGGVGSIAIQLAKAMGATVYTTCRERDQAFVRELGADHAIDFTSQDYIKEIADLTGKKGVNVVFDTIGGMTLSQSPHVLSDAGRVVSIVDLATPQNLVAAWGVNAEYHFVFTRQNRGKLLALKTLLESGRVRPIIGAKFSLEQIPEAHSVLERGEVDGKPFHGKVVISVA